MIILQFYNTEDFLAVQAFYLNSSINDINISSSTFFDMYYTNVLVNINIDINTKKLVLNLEKNEVTFIKTSPKIIHKNLENIIISDDVIKDIEKMINNHNNNLNNEQLSSGYYIKLIWYEENNNERRNYLL